MGLAITTVGAKVYWAAETTAGTRPTSASGWTELVGVNEAPEISLDVEALDCSDISDKIQRNVDGRQSTPGNIEFTLNHRDEVITSWEALVTAYNTAASSGKAIWIEYWFENAAKSYYWTIIPKALGNSGIAPNNNNTIPAPAICASVEGWATAITHSGSN